MATNTTVTSFAQDQFGEQAAEVVQAVVDSMGEAQAAGCRAQEASGMGRRYPYGSVWLLKYELLVESLRDLDGVEVVSTTPATYRLVRVNGRLLVPFKLASSLADIPRRPKVDSNVLLAQAAQGAPKRAPDITLFDDPPADEEPAPSCKTDQEPDVVAEHAPVFIGVVANADSDTLLGLYWGVAVSVSEDGILEWAPESMPLQLAPAPRGTVLRSVAGPIDTRSFNDDEVPDVVIGVRDTPLDEPTSDSGEERPAPQPTGEQDG